MVNFKTAFGTIALMGLLVLAEPKEERTLIIGGGVAGIHMGYRLQQRGQPTEIWEMTDQLGGKARLLYEKEGATMDAGAILFPTVAYREYYKLIEELGLKNRDEMKPYTGVLLDPPRCLFFGQRTEGMRLEPTFQRTVCPTIVSIFVVHWKGSNVDATGRLFWPFCATNHGGGV